jgi:hypothetical protein
MASLLALELACSIGNRIRPGEHSEYHYSGNIRGKYGDDHPALGYRPPADAVLQASRTIDGETVYRARYSFDSQHRRLTPTRISDKRDRFALFFGGSFVFEEGLNDHETLPFFTCEIRDEYRPYNYGFHGYGPQSMLEMFEE